MKTKIYFFIVFTFSSLICISQSYKIVDAYQGKCFNTTGSITCPTDGQTYFGQDAQFTINPPNYTINSDSKTVLDNNTGLTWMRSPNMTNTPPVKTDRMSFAAGIKWVATVNAANYGGYNDWRVPNIKELYSLYLGIGVDPSSYTGSSTSVLTPFIDTNAFKFKYGNTSAGERLIDQQYMSTNIFILNPSESGYAKNFGVNFSDGRIKGYDTTDVKSNLTKTFYVQLVRGNTNYGINNFSDNGDQTISDNATGLMWAKNDNGSAQTWTNALAWVQTQNSLNYSGYNDWRMPDIKELQSILDYSHSPDYDGMPAINSSFFNCSSIINEAGVADFPYYWSSTTHEGYTTNNTGGADADYVAFGRALGWPTTQTNWIDVHGAGAQRCDPKVGPPFAFATTKQVTLNGTTYTGYSFGPQGDAIRGMNYLRLVRTITTPTSIYENLELNNFNVYPNPVSDMCCVSLNKIYSNIKIEIYNSIGSKVKEVNTSNKNKIEINLAGFPSGIYILFTTTDNSTIKNKKFIISK